MKIEDIRLIKSENIADFPKLIKELKAYGIVSFETEATTANTTYQNKSGETISDVANYFDFKIGELDVDKFISDLKDHQAGITDFPKWLELTCKSGVANWIVDLEQYTCTYYSVDNTAVYTEEIPH